MNTRTIHGLGVAALAVLAVAATLIAFTGAALAAGTVSLDSPSVGADGSATVTLTAAAPDGSGIGNWEFDINYNPGDYNGDPTCGGIASGGACAVKPFGVDGTVRFAGATGSADGLTGDIEIGTITFTSNLAPGVCSDLTITIIAFQDQNGTDIPSPTVTNGAVCAPVSTPTPAPTPTPTAPPIDCNANWQAVPAVSPGGTDDRLYGVMAISANDAWAVGSSATQSGVNTLIEHWTGPGWWQAVNSPNSADSNRLIGVAGSSANDVWAVGGSGSGPGDSNGSVLIEHWDGSTWSTVPAEAPAGGARLSSVAVISLTDAWAVGSWNDATGSSPLIEHWDGTSWSIVAAPGASGSNYLSSVAAISSGDVWAVGSSSPDFPSQPNSVFHTVTLHWDGASWSQVSSPDPAAGSYNALFGVTAISSSDVWAVGGYGSPEPFGTPLMLHWNGSQWNQVAGPQQTQGQNGGPVSAAAASANDVWAAGTDIEHWDGNSWTISSPSSPIYTGYMNGLATVPSSQTREAWAVGFLAFPGGSISTRVRHFCSQSGPTPTPVGARSTLQSDSGVGATILVADNTGFAARDEIVINPGGANEEYSVVAALGSLDLVASLQFAHTTGESIVRVASGIPAGDADCSGALGAADLIAVLRWMATLKPYTHCIAAANINCSSAIDGVDALGILKNIGATLAFCLPAQ